MQWCEAVSSSPTSVGLLDSLDSDDAFGLTPSFAACRSWLELFPSCWVLEIWTGRRMADLCTGRVRAENLLSLWNFRRFLAIFSLYCELFLLGTPMDNTITLLASLLSGKTSIY